MALAAKLPENAISLFFRPLAVSRGLLLSAEHFSLTFEHFRTPQPSVPAPHDPDNRKIFFQVAGTSSDGWCLGETKIDCKSIRGSRKVKIASNLAKIYSKAPLEPPEGSRK